MGPLVWCRGWRGIVSTASTSVSKTESPGSNPGAPAMPGFWWVSGDLKRKLLLVSGDS